MSRPLATFACLLLALAGCSTHSQRLSEVRTAYFGGDLARAGQTIERLASGHPKEADVFKLDQATVLLTQGKPKEAEQLLKEARDHFDHLEQKDAAEMALALLTDDQQLAYAGEDYEKVLVRLFLALANLMGDGSDAGAYALQVNEKQQQIIQNGTGPDGKNPKEAYKQVAAGAYLRAALQEATHVHYDDASRSLELVCQWAPDFQAGKADLQRAKTGHHSAPGNGVVYVFALVGRGPYKEEKLEIPTTACLLVADRILSACAKRSVPPTLLPIKVPVVVTVPCDVAGVTVRADGQPRGTTETVTDVGQMARAQCEALKAYVIGRAVARRAIKKAAVYGLKEATRSDKDSVGSLAFDVAGMIWEGTESADTRCWGLLPDKIQVLRVELPAGAHRIALQPVAGHGGQIGPAQTTTVEVENGRNTYVLASFPTGALAGRVVCSQKAK
jgi:hypothetical protein